MKPRDNYLKPWLSWLRNKTPEFEVHGSQIQVLSEPREFYNTLKDRIQLATKRITLSSLYLGTGILERQLVDDVLGAFERSNNRLQVKILLDYNRGSRGKSNSRTLLLPLLCSSGDSGKVQISLYHTPDLRGILKYIMPDRWNEAIGLAHMKLYIVDDALIISGANLSNDYFTNRQDRYILVEDPKLANFFDSLVATVSSFSFQLMPNNTVELKKDWSIHPFKGNHAQFVLEANKRVSTFLTKWHDQKTSIPLSSSPSPSQQFDGMNANYSDSATAKADTWIYPLLQMGPLGIKYDSQITEHILQAASSLTCIHLASGYFNLTESYHDILLKSSQAAFDILMAAPKANGFFGGQGVSGSIPKLYTYIASKFYSRARLLKQDERIRLWEYERPDWTFHAKGLWCTLPEEMLPSITLVGSSNFGFRSVHRDLEAQVIIATENHQLQQSLYKEQNRLYSSATTVTTNTYSHPERYIPIWVRLVAKFFRHFF